MSNKVIYIASDHAGFSLKESVIQPLLDLGFEVIDLGPKTSDRVDYPDFADRVCQKLLKEPAAQGLLICGSGQGMAMRANKYPHIRAALCWNLESAELSRQHNDANLLCLGSRLLEETQVLPIITRFFKTEFEGGRHQNRVQKISAPLFS